MPCVEDSGLLSAWLVPGPDLAASSPRAPLLGMVSHYPQGDWRVGAPLYLCAAIQAVAAYIGIRYFLRSGKFA